MRIGEALFMFRDEYPEMGFLSPASVGGAPLNILVYVENVHALVEQATAAGARVVRPVEAQFHGDLMATLEDPFGYSWFFATRVEEVSPAELERRSADYDPAA
jgi:PhnB protein